MASLYSSEDLVHNLEELRKLKKSKRFTNLLKIILIGFFIGRKNKKRIKELTIKTTEIISYLLKRELEKKPYTLNEKASNFMTLSRLEEIIRTYKKDLSEYDRYSNLNTIIKQRKLIANQIKQLTEQRIETVESNTKEILDSGTYLITSKKNIVMASIDALENEIEQLKETPILNVNYVKNIEKRLETAKQSITNYNTSFIAQRKKEYSHLWSNGFFTLDDEQQTAIVTDDKHNLVVAAAGSGKTEVLITRIGYIVKRHPDSSSSERVLAIAYQRKAREEIEKRLAQRYSIKNVNVSTFHKLGKNILEHSGNKYYHSDIVNENKKHEIIDKIFHQEIENDPNFYNLFLDFIKEIYEEEPDQKAEDEVYTYAKERWYYALNQTRVKSQAEKEIMNFFLTHKINGQNITIRYEPNVYGFRPDFYIPDYDLFIEHWAITKNGTIPQWFNQTTEEYKNSMEMKKKWFSENRKQLVETFAHEYNWREPTKFTELLKSRLIEKIQTKSNEEIVFSPKDYKEIITMIWKTGFTLIEDMANFITIAKIYDLTPENIKQRLREEHWSSKQRTFANLVLPIYIEYEKTLSEYDKIDFEDMINKAIEELDKNPKLKADAYDHILIDEYQDISAQRNKLIKKILDRNPNCKLFCVGDDWQSIMAFAGSNVNYFVNFASIFEDPAIQIISTNYRNDRTIVKAGTSLIRNNKAHQIQKPTQAKKDDTKEIVVISCPKRNDCGDRFYEEIAYDCINRIKIYLQNGYSPEDILVLTRFMRTRIKSRYQFLAHIITFIEHAKQKDLELSCGHANITSRVRLLTVHKSKGLEAKVVFILDVTKGTYGFPSEIEDPTIFDIARIEEPSQDSLEEERRLFYVGITRAIDDLYIYTCDSAKSQFLDEIDGYTKEIQIGTTDTPNQKHPQSQKTIQ